jgi:hypothetical protein
MDAQRDSDPIETQEWLDALAEPIEVRIAQTSSSIQSWMPRSVIGSIRRSR